MPGTVLDFFTGLRSFNLHNNLVRYLSTFIGEKALSQG